MSKGKRVEKEHTVPYVQPPDHVSTDFPPKQLIRLITPLYTLLRASHEDEKPLHHPSLCKHNGTSSTDWGKLITGCERIPLPSTSPALVKDVMKSLTGSLNGVSSSRSKSDSALGVSKGLFLQASISSFQLASFGIPPPVCALVRKAACNSPGLKTSAWCNTSAPLFGVKMLTISLNRCDRQAGSPGWLDRCLLRLPKNMQMSSHGVSTP